MNVQLYIEDEINTMDLCKMNFIFGGNLSGKTKLAKKMTNGFRGADKNFFVDYQIPSKGDFNVIYVNYKNTILDELKMTSSSHFVKFINNKVLLEKEPEFFNEKLVIINDVLANFTNEIKQEYNYLNDLTLSFEVDSFSKFLINNLNIHYNDEDIPLSIAKINYFKLQLRVISSDTPVILLIDDFDDFLDLNSMLKVLAIFEEAHENIRVICFCKHSLIFKYVLENGYFFLRGDKLLSKKTIRCLISESIMGEQNYDGHPLYTSKELEEKVEKYMLESASEICDYLCASINDNEKILETLKKNKKTEKFINFLKNI